MELILALVYASPIFIVLVDKIPSIKQWYIENHTEMGNKLLQIRSAGKEWKELREHQEMLSEDPIALEYYERKRQDRIKAHKEYDKLLWDAEAPEREAKQKALSEKIERERLERIAIYEKETQLKYQHNLDDLRQKELNYYNISQSYGGNMLNPTQRLADVATVLREEPTFDSNTTVPIPCNTIINCTGWVHGQSYGGTDIWFAVKMGTYPDGKDYYQYVWSGSCTEKHTGGLHDFNEYEEDSHTIRSMDGTYSQTHTTKTLIKKDYPSKTRNYYQETPPKDSVSNEGDLWFDTSNGNQLHERVSGVWVNFQHPALPSQKEIETYKDLNKAKFYLNANLITSDKLIAGQINVHPSQPMSVEETAVNVLSELVRPEGLW